MKLDTDHIKEQLESVGYAIVSDLLSSDQIEVLRNEIETLRELAISSSSPWHSSISSCIFETVPGSICEQTPDLRSSYDIYKAHRTTWPLKPQAWDIIFNSPLTRLAIDILETSSAVLFNDQYIVKPPKTTAIESTSSAFAWHKDSDWCREDTKPSPYISIWIALDDASPENGCLYIKPESHHLSLSHSAENNNSGDENIHALPIKTGSAVILSHLVEHCSGENKTLFSRRAWMPQFSSRPILWERNLDAKNNENDTKPVSLSIPLIP